MALASHYRRINKHDDPKKRISDVMAAHYEVQDTHAMIRSVLLDKYGVLATGDREVIIFEPHGGWVPTAKIVEGDPGQGPEGEEAERRWQKIKATREQLPDR